jgi:hypothetical protein
MLSIDFAISAVSSIWIGKVGDVTNARPSSATEACTDILMSILRTSSATRVYGLVRSALRHATADAAISPRRTERPKSLRARDGSSLSIPGGR